MIASAIVDLCEQRYDDETNQVISAARWLSHVNAAYRDFIRGSRWPALVAETTAAIAANGSSVALPAAALQGGVVSVLDSGRALLPLPVGEDAVSRRLTQHWQDRPSSPLYFTLKGQRVHILPAWASGGTLTLAYVAAPAALASGDTPIIPETFHNALVAGAIARQYRDDENKAAADEAQAEFDRTLALAKEIA